MTTWSPGLDDVPNPSLTRLAARRLRQIHADDLPAEIRATVATCLLDFLGACIGGLSSPWAGAVLRYVEGRHGAPQAHQWGLTRLVSAEDAAFGNGALGHSLIRDDMHVMSASHIGVLVLPAALALAQRDRWSGRALLAGVVGGYEMATRLGVAVRAGVVNQHFRPSGINGPFGAPAACVAAAGLDEETAVAALGFAANAAAGVNEWPWAGGQEIYTHAGMAARAGIAAFDLARAGLRASATALEGRDGLFRAYGAGEAGAHAFAGSLSGPYAILQTRHKPFAGCNLIQSPLAAATSLSPQLAGRWDEIDEIVIKTFQQAQSYPGCDNTGPFLQVQQSKMSLQYGVASGLLFGRVDEQTYVDFDNIELARLIGRTRIVIEPEFGRALLKMMQPARIEVALRDGTRLGKSVEDVPWLSDADVETRFRTDASAALTPAAIHRIVEIAHGLWALEDCGMLFDAFAYMHDHAREALK